MLRSVNAMPLAALGLALGQPLAADFYTLEDDVLSVQLCGEQDGSCFGGISDLRMLDGDTVATSRDVWSASFVGAGTGKFGVAASSARCAQRFAMASPDPTDRSVEFRWVNCSIDLPAPPSPGPATWARHTASNCAGTCLPGHSSGPKGGNCQRLPGCGYDAGLPFCEVEAMKAHCSNVSGCTEFNLNGYLYGGSTSVVPFDSYALECWALGGGRTSPANFSVSLQYKLKSGQLEHWIGFSSDGLSLSLWDYSLALDGIRGTSTTKTLYSDSARQLTGVYDSADPEGYAVYFAAHDPKHVVKKCSAGKGALRCRVDALDATLPLREYKAAFPLVATVLRGDWWDLTQVYRAWVLPNAAWTSLGPLARRTDTPEWLENITLWMNNNWGGDPLGPNYGGDPEHVKLEMLKVNERLNLPGHGGHLALHWYEWDTLGYELGSNNTKCDRTDAPCGFDTHYPNYFPARVGCKEAIAEMQQAGMRVIPYINGQLYDTLIPRWKEDNGMAAAQKFPEQSMKTQDHDVPLNPHLEHFDGITSAVMCPHTQYWQDIMRNTVLEIVNDLGFDGCYVDQVGNGEQRNCGDPTHGHSLHGGSFWAEAFYSIMGDVRANLSASKPRSAMFMTEGIVEEVSGPGFDILLGLSWTEDAIWHAIFGGYGYATGGAGSLSKPLAGGLAPELTKQFMVGGTMGWFTYQNYGNQFFDATNAPYVQYIQALSKARIDAKAWMVHGHATRTLRLNDKSASLLGGCFLRDPAADGSEAASVVCAIALPTKGATASYALDLDPSKYGLSVPTGGKVAVSDLQTGEALGSYSGRVTHSGSVPALGVQLLLLQLPKDAPQLV